MGCESGCIFGSMYIVKYPAVKWGHDNVEDVIVHFFKDTKRDFLLLTIRYYFEFECGHRAIGIIYNNTPSLSSIMLELADQLSGSVYFKDDWVYSRETC